MADYKATDTEFIAVADAIREKGGTTETLEWPDGFVDAIDDISGGDVNLQVKNATVNGRVSPDSGYDGLNYVDVSVSAPLVDPDYEMPEGYTELEYVSCDGTQRAEDSLPGRGYLVELEYEYGDIEEAASVFGYRSNSRSYCGDFYYGYRAPYISNPYSFAFYMRNYAGGTETEEDYASLIRSVERTDNAVTILGWLPVASTPNPTTEYYCNYVIAGYRSGNTLYQWIGKITKIVIFNAITNVPVVSYVPALRESDSVAGFAVFHHEGYGSSPTTFYEFKTSETNYPFIAGPEATS